MRKVLAFVLCVVLLSALAVFPAAAERQVTITAYRGTPTINGTFQPDIYSSFYYLEHTGQPDGADGRIAFAWDDDYLYFFIEVNDTTPFHDNETNWQTDNVEFFIDWNNNRGFDIHNDDEPFWQARIHSAPGINNFGVTGHANERWDPPEFDDIRFVVVPLSGDDLSNGYIIEAAFPRNSVEGGITLYEGMVIGFDVTIGDAWDDTDRHSSAYFFNHDDYGMPSNMWQNPEALKALLVLGSAPAAAVELAPPAEGALMSGQIIGAEVGWDNNPDTGRAAAFDGDLDTFFDPAEANNPAYFVGMRMPEAYILTEIRIHPRGDQLGRFNGASIWGFTGDTFDPSTATQIWVSGAAADSAEWHVIPASDFIPGTNTGFTSFAYFNQVEHGDVAEIQLFGFAGGAGGDAPAPAAAAEAVAPAPPTADPITLVILGSLVAAGGAIIAKKRK